jgi:pilus assembly protein Flp/PilA
MTQERKGGDLNMLDILRVIGSPLIARLRVEEGQTMAEYGLLLAVIAVIVVVAALVLGSSISALFNGVAGSM